MAIKLLYKQLTCNELSWRVENKANRLLTTVNMREGNVIRKYANSIGLVNANGQIGAIDISVTDAELKRNGVEF